MSRLLWDKNGQRFFEVGVDRGVLYLKDGSGVPWNGLVSVEEGFGNDGSEPMYFDGRKTLDAPLVGDFSATLTAFTYPPEFQEYEGVGALGNGLFVDDQEPKTFGLSYRTLIGNDIQGPDRAYKIHLLYNLAATPSSKNRETLTDSPTPTNFSWSLSSTPQAANGYRPTAHVILDSRDMWPDMREGLESILYGGTTTEARLPTINELLDFVATWGPQIIVPDSVGGLAQLDDGLGDITPSTTPGLFVALPNTRLSETATPGINQLT